jgi:hypothetical protein
MDVARGRCCLRERDSLTWVEMNSRFFSGDRRRNAGGAYVRFREMSRFA